MRTAAVLPVKRFVRAKQRLGASVAEQTRLALAAAMVADVLDALGRTPAIARTFVITNESAVAEPALELGAMVVADLPERGQSAAAALGVSRAVREGFERVLCVPGDCPSLDPHELEELLATPTTGAEVVIVPDRHGTGTNGLLLQPPGVIEPSFGPDSCARHSALATAAGVSWRLERPRSLLLDIDTGADLAVLSERLGASSLRAERTRAVLARAGSPEGALSVPA